MEGVVTLPKDRDLKTYNESNSLLHSICDFKFVYGLMVLKLILSNTDNLSRYLQGEQMDVITAKKTADAVVKTLSNCRNEESFTQMWSHADVIGQKIRIGINSTKFAFRDAKVPRTRPSCRLQGLTGKTPAAANDSSQQTAKDHFRIIGYYTSIDKVVDSEVLYSEKSIFENYDCGDPCQRKNAPVMVKTMHQNGLHDILPVLYKVASILATIPATSCSAKRSFSALRRIKTF